MATMSVDDLGFHVELSRFEHVTGLLRNLYVPLDAIRGVHSVAEPLQATKGMRVGLGLPGVIKVGTWRGPSTKQFVVARRGEPGLVLELDPARTGYDEAVLSSDNIDNLLAALAARRSER